MMWNEMMDRFAGRRIVAVGMSLGLVALAGCVGGQDDESADLTLESSVVTRGTLRSSVEATGTVEPIRTVEVRSQASGEILDMPVELGDRVQQGELLLQIDPRNEVNALEQARADLDRSQAELTVAESRLERMQSLRDSGIVTTEELESALVSHANARSSFVRAQTSLELAEDQRADATVAAPISGTVIQKGVEEGQVVTGTRDLTGGTVLVTLADLANVQVRTLVDESDVGGIQPGMPATIRVEAYPDRTFTGEVLQVEPQATVEQNVTMFAVLSRIPNEENLLRPGMNADVEIVMGEREGVLKVSNSGIKMPEEASELVSALGMDPAALDQRVAREGGGGGEGDEDVTPARLPSMDEMASMSQDERRELMQSLSAEQRRELASRFGGAARSGGQGGGIRALGGPPGGFGGGFRGGFGGQGEAQTAPIDRSSPRDAFVFVRTDEGGLALRPVVIGLSSWEETEIVDGLEEGAEVVNVPMALVTQSEMLSRFRARIPGMGGG